MEFIFYMTACASVIGVCACISNIAQELRGVRSVLETHTDLEPVKVRTYERREPPRENV